jgi:hypothetical protein
MSSPSSPSPASHHGHGHGHSKKEKLQHRSNSGHNDSKATFFQASSEEDAKLWVAALQVNITNTDMTNLCN